MIMTCKGSASGLTMKATTNPLGGHRRGQGEDRRDDPDRGGAIAIGQTADARFRCRHDGDEDDRYVVGLSGQQFLIAPH